jgi:hypothetical protein
VEKPLAPRATSAYSRAAHPEQIASFALLSLAAAESTELRFVLKTKSGGERYNVAEFSNLDVFAKGPKASTIASGLFDIDAIIQAPQ